MGVCACGFKLKEGTFRLDTRKKFFTMRVVTRQDNWNRLPREIVDASSLEMYYFLIMLDLSRSTNH